MAFTHASTLVGTLAALLLGPRAAALTIIPIFRSSITSDTQAATIEATINAAIALYESDFSDPITVTIAFQERSDGTADNIPLHNPISYQDYRASLISHATSADDAIAVAHLPNSINNPVDDDPRVDINSTLARALGFSFSPSGGDPDSTIELNTSVMNLSSDQNDPSLFSLFAVVCHEMDEALGMASTLNGSLNGDPPPTGVLSAEDLFRYDQDGNRSFTTYAGAVAYFSLDGLTDLARFNQLEGLDYNDWYSPGNQTPQVQDAYATGGATPEPGVELRVLDVLGYTRAAGSVWADFMFTGSREAGTFNKPYKTLAEGVSNVPTGGTILLKTASSTSETNTINKAMTIRAVNGSVMIGR